MRVTVDGWAWLPTAEIDAAGLIKLKKKLTIMPRKVVDYSEEEPKEIQLFDTSRDGFIGIPRQYFYNHAKQQHEVDDQMVDGFTLDDFPCLAKQEGDYAEQGPALETVFKYFSDGGTGGIIQAVPAWGKTAWALAMIHRLKRTALVVVNREFLANQWIKRIKKFLPDAAVGRIQQDQCDYKDKDIVIGMIHSLASKERTYPEEMYRYFGTIIFDEVHRVPAYTWSAIPPKFPARCRIGLSATPRRKDDADGVFWWHIGHVIFKGKKESMMPRLRRIYTRWILPPNVKDNDPKMPTILKMMSANVGRNNQIVKEIVGAAYSPTRRKILVLSHRREHLDGLKDDLEKFCKGNGKPVPSIDFYVGSRKEEELDKAEEAQIILGTYQMAQEALDIPAIDNVHFTTPKGDVEQAIGRIRRFCRPEIEKCKRLCSWRAGQCEGKPQPIVTDYIDNDQDCRAMFSYRMKYYQWINALKKD